MKIKDNIEAMVCPEHGKHPIVEITEKGLTIHACCDEFRRQTIERYKELKAEEIKDAISKAFRRR